MSNAPDPRPEFEKRAERRHEYDSQLIAAIVLLAILVICAGIWLTGILIQRAQGG